jgi:hypothetical protein
MQSSWQSRLSSCLNRISQTLVDNSIILSGFATDVIIIDETLNEVQDPTALNVDEIGVINIVFPSFDSVPMRRFIQSDGTYISANAGKDGKEDKEPFTCYAPIGNNLGTSIPQGSILLKFFENPTGSAPWVLPLRISDILGTFGARTIIWQKILATYYDTPVNTTLYNYLLQLATRRGILGW